MEKNNIYVVLTSVFIVSWIRFGYNFRVSQGIGIKMWFIGLIELTILAILIEGITYLINKKSRGEPI